MTQERISSEEYRRRVGAPVAEKPQIRLPAPRKMNKTEEEYGRILRSEFPLCIAVYEGITLHLPSGTRYRPDWTVWFKSSMFMLPQPQLMLVVETKGAHIHNSASIRAFKEARSAFPWLRFRFAQKIKGEWRIAE